MMAQTVKFATVPAKYAPKRKFLEFTKPQWHTKLGEFADPDVLSWITNTYQTKAYPTQKAFNDAYDTAIALGMWPSEMVGWRNKTMILTKEDVDNFDEEFKGGAFEHSQVPLEKTLKRMKAALETGEKVIFVY
jgi:hypothetical protein